MATAAVRHVVVQHLVGLDEVPLHGGHLGHDLLPVELGGVRLPLALCLVFVLCHLGGEQGGGGEWEEYGRRIGGERRGKE